MTGKSSNSRKALPEALKLILPTKEFSFLLLHVNYIFTPRNETVSFIFSLYDFFMFACRSFVANYNLFFFGLVLNAN